MKITVPEMVEFSEDSFTERGEKVYKNMKIEYTLSSGTHGERILECDQGIGITEEWIEDSINGCLAALKRDFPQEEFNVLRVKPNHIHLQYAGARYLQ